MNSEVERTILIWGQERYVTITWHGGRKERNGYLSVSVRHSWWKLQAILDINCGFLYRRIAEFQPSQLVIEVVGQSDKIVLYSGDKTTSFILLLSDISVLKRQVSQC
jgi:hypothetical protein